MDNYILSICIPTYNRQDLLRVTLDNLIHQILNLEEKIELCVSDNCSRDSTSVLLTRYKKQYPFIKVNSNKFNCGYDYNVCRLINMSQGTYVWILSDDDIVLDHRVDYLVSLITKYSDLKISSIFMKPQFEQMDNIKFTLKKLNLENNIFSDYLYNSGEEALKQVNWLVSFVSAFVLRKEYLGDNFPKFFGSGFLHTPMILDCLKNGNSVITYDVQILCRQNNSGGYNIYKYFGTNIMSIFNYYKKNNIFKFETINFVVTEWLRFCVLGNVIYSRLEKNRTYQANNNILDLIVPYYNNKYFLSKVLPILVIPKILFKVIAKLKKW